MYYIHLLIGTSFSINLVYPVHWKRSLAIRKKGSCCAIECQLVVDSRYGIKKFAIITQACSSFDWISGSTFFKCLSVMIWPNCLKMTYCVIVLNLFILLLVISVDSWTSSSSRVSTIWVAARFVSVAMSMIIFVIAVSCSWV